ncbi:MAG: hypothetical protein ACREJO_05830 [Phycisphaerales bacterium]
MLLTTAVFACGAYLWLRNSFRNVAEVVVLDDHGICIQCEEVALETTNNGSLIGSPAVVLTRPRRSLSYDTAKYLIAIDSPEVDVVIRDRLPTIGERDINLEESAWFAVPFKVRIYRHTPEGGWQRKTESAVVLVFHHQVSK